MIGKGNNNNKEGFYLLLNERKYRERGVKMKGVSHFKYFLFYIKHMKDDLDMRSENVTELEVGNVTSQGI